MARGSAFFQALTKYAQQEGVKGGTKKALDWYRAAAMQIQLTNPTLARNFMTTRKGIARIRPISDLSVKYTGRLIFFKYDAKTKEKLPYWDMYPMVFPIKFIRQGEHSGFLGLNIHYIPPTYRVKLMDALFAHYNDKYLDENKRLQLDYHLLNTSSRYKWFRPCVKRYLTTHVRTRFNLIAPEEWVFCAFLPLAKWQKASEAKVWAESKKKILNG